MVFAGLQHGHQVAVLNPRDVLMGGGTYTSESDVITPKVSMAADAPDSELEMKGSFNCREQGRGCGVSRTGGDTDGYVSAVVSKGAVCEPIRASVKGKQWAVWATGDLSWWSCGCGGAG